MGYEDDADGSITDRDGFPKVYFLRDVSEDILDLELNLDDVPREAILQTATAGEDEALYRGPKDKEMNEFSLEYRIDHPPGHGYLLEWKPSVFERLNFWLSG